MRPATEQTARSGGRRSDASGASGGGGPLAVQAALRLIARRARTEAELRAALSTAHSTAAVEAAIARLRELGYVDDAQWARDYLARGRSAVRGRALLRGELTARGVATATAAAALELHDELEAARRAAAPRVRSLRSLDGAARARRLGGFLARRGFDRGTVDQVLRELRAGLPAEAGSGGFGSVDSEA